MDFKIEDDFQIFDELLKNRSEISPENLKKDLIEYYLPYIEKLIERKKNITGGLIVGTSAIQGAGKSTQGEVLGVLLKHFGFEGESLSIDDHYITHKELCELRTRDPRYIRRGVTHDIALAILELRNLRDMGDEPILISGYDKGANKGDGERFKWVSPTPDVIVKVKVVEEELTVNKEKQNVKAMQLVAVMNGDQEIFLPNNMGSDVALIDPMLTPEALTFLNDKVGQEIVITSNGENATFTGESSITIPQSELPKGWKAVLKKPDFIFYDGWMLGARQVMDESVFDQNLPALTTPEDKQFAKDVNKKLENYEVLWQMIHFLNVLYVPNYQMSIEWRDLAEEALRKKGEGMTKEQITEFVHYFWRSVHPAIHIKNIAHDSQHTHQVVVIGDDHLVQKVTTPDNLEV